MPPIQMPLFDEIVRTDSRPGKRTESQFRFLNRVDRPDFSVVRMLMEESFDRFPHQAKPDLRARFRSDDPRQSLGAFWEMYLHEIHRRLGYTLERDPEVSGTTVIRRHPIQQRRRQQQHLLAVARDEVLRHAANFIEPAGRDFSRHPPQERARRAQGARAQWRHLASRGIKLGVIASPREQRSAAGPCRQRTDRYQAVQALQCSTRLRTTGTDRMRWVIGD